MADAGSPWPQHATARHRRRRPVGSAGLYGRPPADRRYCSPRPRAAPPPSPTTATLGAAASRRGARALSLGSDRSAPIPCARASRGTVPCRVACWLVSRVKFSGEASAGRSGRSSCLAGLVVARGSLALKRLDHTRSRLMATRPAAKRTRTQLWLPARRAARRCALLPTIILSCSLTRVGFWYGLFLT